MRRIVTVLEESKVKCHLDQTYTKLRYQRIKGYIHKILIVRYGKDDNMDNVTNRQEKLPHSTSDLYTRWKKTNQWQKCWRIKDSNICRRKTGSWGNYKKDGPKGTISIGERKEDSRKITQTNKELISVGYMIGSIVASWSKHGKSSWWISFGKTSLTNFKKKR